MKNLKLLRTDIGLSQKEFGKIIHASQNTVSAWESGSKKPSYDVVQEIADYFDVSIDYLLGRTNVSNSSLDLLKYGIIPIVTKKIPFQGEIACGEPICNNEGKEEYIEVDTDIIADFCLRAKGDSMINARIFDGDLVFIKRQPMVNNGEMAAIVIDDEITLKRVYYYPNENKLMLSAENSKYEPFVYIGDELDKIEILGKAVAFRSNIT